MLSSVCQRLTTGTQIRHGRGSSYVERWINGAAIRRKVLIARSWITSNDLRGIPIRTARVRAVSAETH